MDDEQGAMAPHPSALRPTGPLTLPLLRIMSRSKLPPAVRLLLIPLPLLQGERGQGARPGGSVCSGWKAEVAASCYDAPKRSCVRRSLRSLSNEC